MVRWSYKYYFFMALAYVCMVARTKLKNGDRSQQSDHFAFFTPAVIIREKKNVKRM